MIKLSRQALRQGDEHVKEGVVVILAIAACIKLADTAIQAITGTPASVVYPDLIHQIPDRISAGYLGVLGAKMVYNRMTHRNSQSPAAPA